MEIHSLRLVITDSDLVPLAARLAKEAEGVENLVAKFTPEGVVVTGQYPTPFGFTVGFETLWELSAAGPEIHARLAQLNMAGVPAGWLRGALLKMVRDTVEDVPGVSIVDERVVIRIAETTKEMGMVIDVTFTAVRMEQGRCTIEAGREA